VVIVPSTNEPMDPKAATNTTSQIAMLLLGWCALARGRYYVDSVRNMFYRPIRMGDSMILSSGVRSASMHVTTTDLGDRRVGNFRPVLHKILELRLRCRRSYRPAKYNSDGSGGESQCNTRSEVDRRTGQISLRQLLDSCHA